MIGRVGTCFGQHGINIVSAAVGRHADDRRRGKDQLAVMTITTDAPVPRQVVEQIVALDGFEAGRTVTL
jgi:D-3-phosphoglycerate dehydrogenase